MVRPGPDAPRAGDDVPPAEYWTYERFRAAFAAAAEDITLVEDYGSQFRLELDPHRTSAEERRVSLIGHAGDFSEAFNVRLAKYMIGRSFFHIQVGPIQLPEPLSGVVEMVFGLDDRPLDFPASSRPGSGRAATPIGDLVDYYAFPRKKSGTAIELDGAGQTIGIVRRGGPYGREDISPHFKRLGIPMPSIAVVGVPLDLEPDAATETQLDIEIVGTIVPKARIVVYYAAAHTYSSLIQTTVSALTDPINKPSVLSISWGDVESRWAVAEQTYLDEWVRTAAQYLGVTVCAASGDHGSGGIPAGAEPPPPDALDHVVFPASSPHVLACGGTRLKAAAAAASKEVVWRSTDNASGGGVSDTFELPPWQQNMGVPKSKNPGARIGRGVPDVAAHAGDYDVVIGGQKQGIGGTSASTPLWAGLLARINQARGKRLGFVHPYLYKQYLEGPGKEAFHDITVGNNRCATVVGKNIYETTPPPYAAKVGWDACTGLGSPRGAQLTQLLMNAP